MSPLREVRRRLLDGEIDRFGFFRPSEAEGLLSPRTWRRARAAMDALTAGRIAYLQDGYA